MVDPLGGAYAIESLTDAIEAGALRYIENIDKMGGVVKAIEAGYIQREIQDSAYRYQKAVEAEEEIVVGVNKFTVDEEVPGGLLKVDPEIEIQQRERLADLRARREDTQVEAVLSALSTAARTEANLVPCIFEAVRAYATVGEISNSLRSVFGEYHGQAIF